MELYAKQNEPLNWDFQTIEYDASGNPINVRHYATMYQSSVSTATHNAGVVTVTTLTDHNIVLPWSGSVTYGAGVRVIRYGACYVAVVGTNLNQDPTKSIPDGNTYWLKDDAYTGDVFTTPVVAISDVAGMTDLNGKFTVVSTATTKTFTVTLTTVQAYTSGGLVKAGKFQFRKLIKYDTSSNPIEVEILYT